MRRTGRLTLFAALGTAAALVVRQRRGRSNGSNAPRSVRPDPVHPEASEADLLDQHRIVGAAPTPERRTSDREAPIEAAIDLDDPEIVQRLAAMYDRAEEVLQERLAKRSHSRRRSAGDQGSET